MALSRKQLNENLKARYLPTVIEAFEKLDLDVRRVGSNEIAIPVLNELDDEEWLVVTLRVPTGSRDGEAYDGYAMEKDYEMKRADKIAKAAEAKAKKEAKIAKDKALREQKKAQREK